MGIKLLALFIILFPTLVFAGNEDIKRPEKWATPIELEGAPNLHKVSDVLYRSAQPTKKGMENLEKLGIETIVNLRSFSSDRSEIEDTHLAYEHLHMKAWHAEEKEVISFLKVVTNPKRTPVLVHCLHGADRTGTMCAVYRIAVQGWTIDEAMDEMINGGYNFHEVWANLEPWIRNLDFESIKKKVGIQEQPVTANNTAEIIK